MKIEVKEKPSKEFIREMLSAGQLYRQILKHPDSLPKDNVKNMLTRAVISVITLAADLALYFFDDHSVLYIFCAVIFLLAAIFSFVIYANQLKTIDSVYKNSGDSVFEVNSKGISITKDDSVIKMNWDQMFRIFVLKHGVLFIPKNGSCMIMGLQSTYVEQVLTEIDKLDHWDLVRNFNN